MNDLTTFEGRQAYIAKCEREIEDAQYESMRHRVAYEASNARIQLALFQMNMEMTTLIYRGMFDPTFCAPKTPAAQSPR